MAVSEQRKAILDKIKELEKQGLFDHDVENDPPFKPIVKGEVDFTTKKLSSKIKSHICEKITFKAIKSNIKEGNIIIDDIKGIENLTSLNSGAIVTANHFNPFDSVPLHLAIKKYKHQHLYKVIKEGNYSFEGFYGYILKNFYTLPIPSDFNVLKDFLNGVDTLLKKGNLILVYPEQSMWWNYSKPRPLKDGAFRFAIKSDVPVLPTFVTMESSDKLDSDGCYINRYTLHICKPIYPNKDLSLKDNIEYMKKENYQLWKDIYQNTYKKELKYEEE